MKELSLCFLISFVLLLNGKAQYKNNAQLGNEIQKLVKNKEIVSSQSLATTSGGKNISVITIGKGEKNNKPGIAIIGGINGVSLASTEIVLQIAEKLTSSEPQILDDVTFYLIPNVSPDATEQYFESLKYERLQNAEPYDDDRDGSTDEDGFDDLNNDGMITLMRILDPDKGDYMIHPENPEVMLKADRTKNQKGEYRVMYEGIDNDKDGEINEDVPGGIIFNKNFSFNYQYFSEGAGYNALSEIESRAVAQFLFDHWNIFAVLCIGPENNLSEFSDLKAEIADKRIKAVIDDEDKSYFERVVNLYKSSIHLPDSSKVSPTGGDLLSWIYFHYNRFGFSTPAWNVGKNKEGQGSAEFDYLKWATDNNIENQTIPWQIIDHPDFPGKTVEVGGIKPFQMYNPPIEYIDTVAELHYDFVMDLADMHPAITFNDVKITKQSNNLYLVEVELTNTGGFPTMPVSALNTKWVKKIRLDIEPSQQQTIVGGRKIFLYDRIIPGETIKSSWLISNKGTVQIKAGSPQTGFISKKVELN